MDLRNSYIHTCRINAGYRIGLDDGDKPQPILHAFGPEVSSFGPPLVALGPTEIQTSAEHLADHLGKFLDGIKWQAAWALPQEQLGHLPVNPEPEYSQLADRSAEEIPSLILALNERYIGEGLRQLREQQ